jgi:hypothetical protein
MCAHGLLSVYWSVKYVPTVEERFVSLQLQGSHHIRSRQFPLPSPFDHDLKGQ